MRLRSILPVMLAFTQVHCTTARLSGTSTPEVFYHGTNSVFGYYVCQGVDLNIGREALDFNASKSKAFYVTKDRASAEKWGANKSRMYGGSSVVIHYTVASTFRQNFNGRVLDDEKEWKNFVRRSRLNANDHSYDFVEGKILKNPGDEGQPEGFGHQLAVTSRPLANYFSQSVTAGCENVSEPPKETILDEAGEDYKKILRSSLAYRIRDQQVFTLEGPATDSKSIQALEQELQVNIPIRQKLGVLPKDYPVRWDKKHQYLIKPYLAGRNLGEMWNDPTFWEPQSKRRTRLIGLIQNLIFQGVFIRGLKSDNLVYSSGQWYLMAVEGQSYGHSSQQTRKLFAKDRKNGLAALWLGPEYMRPSSSSALEQRREKIQQLIAEALSL